VRLSTPQRTDELFHPGKSADVWIGKGLAGRLGMIHPQKQRELKIKNNVWMADLDWKMIANLSRCIVESRKFKKMSEFPGIERDFALLVKHDVKVEKITQIAVKIGQPLAKVVRVFDIYRGEQVPEGMTSVAVRVIFSDESRSLKEVEADEISEKILAGWKSQIGAELRN